MMMMTLWSYKQSSCTINRSLQNLKVLWIKIVAGLFFSSRKTEELRFSWWYFNTNTVSCTGAQHNVSYGILNACCGVNLHPKVQVQSKLQGAPENFITDMSSHNLWLFISGSAMIFGLLQMRNNFLPFNDLTSLLTFKILPFLNTTQTWHRSPEVDSARPPAVVASFSFKQFHMWCCKLTLNEIGMRESLGINIYCCVNTSLLDEVRDF